MKGFNQNTADRRATNLAEGKETIGDSCGRYDSQLIVQQLTCSNKRLHVTGLGCDFLRIYRY